MFLFCKAPGIYLCLYVYVWVCASSLDRFIFQVFFTLEHGELGRNLALFTLTHFGTCNVVEFYFYINSIEIIGFKSEHNSNTLKLVSS